jgi:dephospho-CoA kinase
MLDNAVVVTGGIASGKSTSVAIFSMYGFRVIDADKIAHKILDQKYETIREVFGKEFIVDSRVDRKALGRVIFADSKKRRTLEEILHPAIREEILEEATKQERFGKPYLIDIPLFFEKGNFDISKVLVVYTPKELQIKRLMKRDKISKDEAILKIETQMDIEKKRELATWVIDNSKDLKHLQNECERVKEEILKSFEKK